MIFFLLITHPKYMVRLTIKHFFYFKFKGEIHHKYYNANVLFVGKPNVL
jgi:hypothetical protein